MVKKLSLYNFAFLPSKNL